MRSVFLDSDILLDLILERDPFYEWSLGVFLEIDKKQLSGNTSVHALLNIHYMAKKKFGEKDARAAIKMLTTKLSIIAEDSTIVQQAIDSDFADFEDAVQYYAAKSAGAEFIITRNIKDYQQATIPVLTAEQFLKML